MGRKFKIHPRHARTHGFYVIRDGFVKFGSRVEKIRKLETEVETWKFVHAIAGQRVSSTYVTVSRRFECWLRKSFKRTQTHNTTNQRNTQHSVWIRPKMRLGTLGA